LEKKREECEVLIEMLIEKYKRKYYSKRHPPNITDKQKTDQKNKYVRMKLCIRINKMLNQTDISQEVRKYLNKIYSDTCVNISQRSINSLGLLDLSR